MSQPNDKNSRGRAKRTLSNRDFDSITDDLYQLHDNTFKLPRYDLKYGSPSQIIRQLSRLPKKQITPTSPPETISPPEPTLPDQSMGITPSSKHSPTIHSLPTIQPLIQKPKRLTALDLKQREMRFSQRDYDKALEKPDINVRFFQRKHRHDDDGDTLSEITDRTTLSFSRFDRVFKEKTVPKDHVLPPSPARVLEIPLQSQPVSPVAASIEAATESIHRSSRSPIIVSKTGPEKQQGKASPSTIELKPTDEAKSKTETIHLSGAITPRSPLVQPPIIDQEPKDQDIPLQDDFNNDFSFNDDGFDMVVDYGDEAAIEVENMEIEESGTEDGAPVMETASSDTNVEEMVTEPRQKAVIQGNSFIRRRIQDIHTDSSSSVLPTRLARSLFTDRLDHSLKLRSPSFQKIPNLFFDQMVDDLNSYKDNQPRELQDEVTEEDLILLMKRQRLIKDTDTLESLVHKYFPREYSDFICKSALAYNVTHPHSDQELQDITDDDADDDDEI